MNLRKDHSQTEHVSLTPGDARVRRSPRPLCDSRHAAARGACARRPLCYSPVGRRRSVEASRRRRLLHKRLVRGTRASDEPHQARRRQAGGLCQRYAARSAEHQGVRLLRPCVWAGWRCELSGRGAACCMQACVLGWLCLAHSGGLSLVRSARLFFAPLRGPLVGSRNAPGANPGRSLDARWLPAWRRGVGMDE